MVCWMSTTPLAAGDRLRAQAHHALRPARRSRTCATGSTSTRCTATPTATALELNDIGRVTLRTSAPLVFDDYRRNRTTGSFILIDEATNDTVGAGMIVGARTGESPAARPDAAPAPPTSPGTRRR